MQKGNLNKATLEKALLRQQIEQLGGDEWLKVNTDLYDMTKRYVAEYYEWLVDYMNYILERGNKATKASRVETSSFASKLQQLKDIAKRTGASCLDVKSLTRCGTVKAALDRQDCTYAHDRNTIPTLHITLDNQEQISIIDLQNDFNRNFINSILSLEKLHDSICNAKVE